MALRNLQSAHPMNLRRNSRKEKRSPLHASIYPSTRSSTQDQSRSRDAVPTSHSQPSTSSGPLSPPAWRPSQPLTFQIGSRTPPYLKNIPPRPSSPPSVPSSPPRPLSRPSSRPPSPTSVPSSPAHPQTTQETLHCEVDPAQLQQLRSDIKKSALRIVRAEHHRLFLSNCSQTGIIPKGLTITKKINIMDGPDQSDCLELIQEKLLAASQSMISTLADYYEDLVDSEQQRLQLFNSKLSSLLKKTADQEVPERDFREKLTGLEDGLREKLHSRRENKTSSLRNPGRKQIPLQKQMPQQKPPPNPAPKGQQPNPAPKGKRPPAPNPPNPPPKPSNPPPKPPQPPPKPSNPPPKARRASHPPVKAQRPSYPPPKDTRVGSGAPLPSWNVGYNLPRTQLPQHQGYPPWTMPSHPQELSPVEIAALIALFPPNPF